MHLAISRLLYLLHVVFQLLNKLLRNISFTAITEVVTVKGLHNAHALAKQQPPPRCVQVIDVVRHAVNAQRLYNDQG